MTRDLTGPPPRLAERVVARPAFRICATFDGGFADGAARETALLIHDVFIDSFGGDIRFATLSTNPSRPARAVKATTAKRDAVRNALVAGNTTFAALRLYGTDENPLGVPHIPFLTVSSSVGGPPLLDIEMALPPDIPDPRGTADTFDALIAPAGPRFGYQGFGFVQSPLLGFGERDMPRAYQPFPAAVMGQFNAAPAHFLFRTERVAERWGDYDPGLPDMGWRTYVGADYAGRLGDPNAARAAGVVIEPAGDGVSVTAGDIPRWGHEDDPETKAAFRAAYRYLRPAFADQSMLDKRLWGDRTPVEAGATRGYFNRWAETAD